MIRGRNAIGEKLERRALLSSAIGVAPAYPEVELPPPALETPLAPPFGLEQTFLLHSRPGATKRAYLDFDGHVTSGTQWNTSYTGGADIVTPAYTIDADPAFSATELERIQRIWQRTAEDFAPFDIDITTEQPPIDDLRNTGGGDTRWGIRVVIGGNNAWFGGGGGVAYINSFNFNSDTPVFCFEDNLANGDEKVVAECNSHEIGHSVNLFHDGRSSPVEEYYGGHGTGDTGWAPIMGVGYNRNLTQWSKGEYTGANQFQNDLAIITTGNGFTYRPDDHGNTAALGSALTVNAAGVIETTTDVDVFTFSFPNGGVLNLSINPFYIGPNLDVLAELYNSSSALVASSNPADALNATINLSVPAGAYSLHISGVGKGDPATTGYSDYASLGQYTIGGAFDATPAEPVNPSPAHGATGVNRTNLLLNWDDAANAISYDVYVDNMTTLKANVTASQWLISPEITGGSHTWKVVARNGITTASGQVWTFDVVPLPVPAMPVLVSPAVGQVVTSKPYVLDWEDSANATSYAVHLFTSTNPVSPAPVGSTWTSPANAPDANYTWHVRAKNGDHTTIGPFWTFTLDTTAPTSTLQPPSPATGSAFLDFNVTYTDATSGILVSTLDSNDVTVTGPNGYSASATFISVNNPANGSPRTATYHIPAPGGFWNDGDIGLYTVTQVEEEVTDRGGLFRAAGTIGTFTPSTLGFAWMSSGTLNVAFDGSAAPVLLSTSGSNIVASKNASSPSFSGVSAITILGSSSDDRLQINAPLTPPLFIGNSGGNDLLEVTGGTYTFASNIGAWSPNVGVYVAGGASAVFNVSQTIRSLSVDGTATLSAGGDKSITLTDLAITGRLNLTNNTLQYNYPNGPSPFSEVSDWIAEGKAGGDWSGNGLVTDRPEAMSPTNLTTLGATNDSTSITVKYTYAGDANLDEVIDGDDFFAIDIGYGVRRLYYYGDFDYSGEHDVDDYFLIDSNYHKAQTPLP